MQEKTKKYIKNLIWEFEIRIDTMYFETKVMKKELSKLRKFYDKVIKNM